MKHGNFTGLAQNYSDFRPGYSQNVLKILLTLLDKPIPECDFVDVGAGTGIWTRMLAHMKPKSIIAVEPNDDMRNIGIRDSKETKILWKKGAGEVTNLLNNSANMLSMASSFHWVNFEKGCQEFHRVLKPGGRFVALWNPRLIEVNPLLHELENYIVTLKPDVKRISSGRSELVENLTDRLYQSRLFDDVIYIEGRHKVSVSPAQYIGAWRSVNDVQVQLGPEKFEKFISHLEEQLSEHSFIEVTYLTRAWSALRKDSI